MILADDAGHLTNSCCHTRFEGGLGVSVRVAQSWQQEIRYLLCAKVLDALSHALDCCILHFSLIVIEKLGEGLDKIAISNFFAE